MKMILLTLYLFTLVQGLSAQSLDLALNGYGLSLGNSIHFTGLRINAVDRQVERIGGLNLTLWNPGENPEAVYSGLILGIIGTKGRRIDGIALSGIGVNASERVRGIAVGTLGVGTRSLTGIGAGLVMVDIRRRIRGIAVAGVWTGDSERLEGLALSPGIAMAKAVRGITIAGLMAGGRQSFSGLALSSGGIFGERFHGIGIGGLGGGGKELRGLFACGVFLGCEDLDGIACSLGGLGGLRMDGVMLAGLGLGAKEQIRGIALGGAVVFAREATGLTVGALNGLYIDRIDLEDFLHFNLANERFTGLSIGFVNYTAHLEGVQVGLVNYVGNNPRWLKLLPLVNVHL